jgi:hypothetical protein
LLGSVIFVVISGAWVQKMQKQLKYIFGKVNDQSFPKKKTERLRFFLQLNYVEKEMVLYATFI